MGKHAPPLVMVPRRGLNRVEAAAYIGVSPTKFLELVGERRMPEPVRIDRRAIWDVRELDEAFDALRERQETAEADPVDAWGSDDTP